MASANEIAIPPEVATAMVESWFDRFGRDASFEDRMTAALKAGLAAWPHQWMEDARLLGAGAGPCLILPLTEMTNG